MSIFGSIWRYGKYKVMFMLDPNRYRATIWRKEIPDSKYYTVHVKTMWSKEENRLLERVEKWVKNN